MRVYLMKTIGIIIDSNAKLAVFLMENLKIIFRDYVAINSYFLKELSDGDLIRDDVILAMSKERAVEAKRYISNSENIIVIHRTIKDKEAYSIFTIPKNTKVLVVNDTKETTLETVSLLYQIGINHLNLIPYEEGGNYSDIKIAITPGESDRVPVDIQKIIDTGNRYIDISTFIQIINKLSIDNKEIRSRLIKYSETIITLDNGIKSQYKELYIKNEELDMVLNLSNEGILLMNNDNKISLSNKRFKVMFNIDEEIADKKIDMLFSKKIKDILYKENLIDELMEFNNKFIIINKHKIDYLGENAGYYYNFQEVTYIKQLEQNLSKKLRDKGFIARYSFDFIKTNSRFMVECVELAKKIALSDLTVFITGESGTGKELFAQSIHNFSKKCKQPFVAVNCAAFNESLLESELFGYEGGSFTGALKEGKVGLFELANNGTIFLDEIGDMPLSLQTRLLRVLQERQVMRIGSQRVTNINIRVIAATNKNIFEMVQKGLFREDLFYRINVLPINIPPLRKRQEDIIPLLQYFIGRSNKLELTDEVNSLLLNYNWPGNIRELENVASYIALMNEEKATLDKLPYYLLLQKNSFEKELTVIEGSFSITKGLEIIKMVDQCKSIGRKSIENSLRGFDINTSESEIRRILLCLNSLGIVSSNVGRKGTEITAYGKAFMKWIENRTNI
ncbi:two component, sigma54 specific, transcriptional regulator, Fis family [Desulfosporosinus metallidurans]|uniref:Two component, sigma54 specific, transcriptional regulator, Fis family n=2 Tax=Desulfosporosinus metallidurans TaxID=1888891 RepID=A0A1Q8R0A0_9FIRM|nr:two component, sigma54 specific, transcriptional regulator, Fis family [Desulfosporosinus metallidurans]